MTGQHRVSLWWHAGEEGLEKKMVCGFCGEEDTLMDNENVSFCCMTSPFAGGEKKWRPLKLVDRGGICREGGGDRVRVRNFLY